MGLILAMAGNAVGLGNFLRFPGRRRRGRSGGVDEQGQWKPSKPGQLVPFKPLHNLFRGKMLASLRQALRDHRLVLPAWMSNTDADKQLRSLYGSAGT